MKKNISKIAIFTFSSFLLVGGLLLAESNPTIEANAAEFSYVEGRDKFELNESGDLEVTFTITSYDDAAHITKYWTVYLVNKDTPIQYYNSHKLYELEGGRGRNRADYYFPTVGADVIDGAGTHTITVNHDAKAYHSDDPNPCLEEDLCGPNQDTGQIFSEVYDEENWFVCVGPMFPQWNYMEGVSEYICPIDYYVGRMGEVVPGLGHEHSWSYNANGANLTATCTAEDCPFGSVTISLVAPTNLTYDGTAKEASFESSQAWGGIVPAGTLKYYNGDQEVSACIDIGTYTAKYTMGNATAVLEFTIVGKTISDPKNSEVSVEVVNAVIPENVELRVEVRADVKEKDIPEQYNIILKQLAKNEEIAKVYDVKLIQKVGDVETEIQPYDLKPGLKLKVHMAIPEGLDAANMRILHIHSLEDMEFIDNPVKVGNDLVFEISKLSQFAFIAKTKAAGLPAGAIVGIILGSLLLVCLIAFLLLFFVFAKFIVVKDKDDKEKVVKAIKIGKDNKDNKDYFWMFTFNFKKELRAEDEVFDRKQDAEDFLNKNKGQEEPKE